MRDVSEPAESPRQRSAPKPRLQVASLFVNLFADRIRLSAYEDLGRFFVEVGLDPELAGQNGSPVTIDLPKKDRAAYTRAVAAFNEIMDEHDKGEAEKAALRRALPADNRVELTDNLSEKSRDSKRPPITNSAPKGNGLSA